MTKQVSQESENNALLDRKRKKNAPASSAARKKEEDRETDHRGVLMPRRTRVGGVIMPQ